jgi:hypothetical protein
MDNYLHVEEAYIDAFAAFADESNIDVVQVRDIDQGVGLREGDVLRVSEARDVVRQMLREQVVCKLEEPANRFALHVGFDLYMYVGSELPCVGAVERAQASGLYIESDHPSPQVTTQ